MWYPDTAIKAWFVFYELAFKDTRIGTPWARGYSTVSTTSLGETTIDTELV
jgi:hypothetical protein